MNFLTRQANENERITAYYGVENKKLNRYFENYSEIPPSGIDSPILEVNDCNTVLPLRASVSATAKRFLRRGHTLKAKYTLGEIFDNFLLNAQTPITMHIDLIRFVHARNSCQVTKEGKIFFFGDALLFDLKTYDDGGLSVCEIRDPLFQMIFEYIGVWENGMEVCWDDFKMGELRTIAIKRTVIEEILGELALAVYSTKAIYRNGVSSNYIVAPATTFGFGFDSRVKRRAPLSVVMTEKTSLLVYAQHNGLWSMHVEVTNVSQYVPMFKQIPMQHQNGCRIYNPTVHFRGYDMFEKDDRFFDIPESAFTLACARARWQQEGVKWKLKLSQEQGSEDNIDDLKIFAQLPTFRFEATYVAPDKDFLAILAVTQSGSKYIHLRHPHDELILGDIQAMGWYIGHSQDSVPIEHVILTRIINGTTIIEVSGDLPLVLYNCHRMTIVKNSCDSEVGIFESKIVRVSDITQHPSMRRINWINRDDSEDRQIHNVHTALYAIDITQLFRDFCPDTEWWRSSCISDLYEFVWSNGVNLTTRATAHSSSSNNTKNKIFNQKEEIVFSEGISTTNKLQGFTDINNPAFRYYWFATCMGGCEFWTNSKSTRILSTAFCSTNLICNASAVFAKVYGGYPVYSSYYPSTLGLWGYRSPQHLSLKKQISSVTVRKGKSKTKNVYRWRDK